MRPIQNYLLSRLKNKIQTTGNNNEIRSHVRLSRPTTVLENDLYLEKLPLGINNCDDCSIAVAHETPSRRNSRIDIMYIENGVAKWCISPTKYPMEEHVFVDTGFMESATSCSICYDSQTKLTRDGIVEMLTYGEPWLFWTDPLGELWCQNGMDETTRISLATTNVSDVSAIRGLYNTNKNYDYGLILFFLLGGSIYYRQLVNNVWTDAEPISFGPTSTYVEISATRSWDTRIFLQARTNTGSIYELVTQQQGFAKNDLGEYVGDVQNEVSMNINLVDIVTLPPAKTTDYIGNTSVSMIGNVGVSDEPSVINLIKVMNVREDSNYGKRIDIEMTERSTIDTTCWSDAFKHYILVDSRGYVYAPYKVIYSDFKSSKASLYFTNFNSAVGPCILKTKSGFLKTMFGKILPEMSYQFTPTGLVPPAESGPRPIEISNSNDGNELYIEFDKPVYTVDESFNVDKFEIYAVAKNYNDPNVDNVIRQDRVPISVMVSGTTVTLRFNNMSTDNLRNFNDYEINIRYVGGNLTGTPDQDIVSSFDRTFVPTGMNPANNQWTGIDISTSESCNEEIIITDIMTMPPAKTTDYIGDVSTTVSDPLIEITNVGDV